MYTFYIDIESINKYSFGIETLETDQLNKVKRNPGLF